MPTKLTPAQGVAPQKASNNTTPTALIVALAALISLSTTQVLRAQDTVVDHDSLPVPSANAKTVRLSDLAPEVASKIKSQHYAAQDQTIKQAYHQQLQENRQRSAISAQRAVFEDSGFARPLAGGFSPAAYQAPTGGQAAVAQASHNAAFPRTAANKPDEYLDQPSVPTPGAAYEAPPAAAYSAPPSDAYSAAPSSAYSAPQTYMPPVHIPPTQPQYTSGIPGRSINGHRNAVQNFAPQQTSEPTFANKSYEAPVRRVKRSESVFPPRRQSAQRTPVAPTPAQQTPKENTHVFLQDRIANALARHFKRGKKSKEQPVNEPLAETEALSSTEQSTQYESAQYESAQYESAQYESAGTASEPALATETLTPPVYQPESSLPDYQQSEIVIDDQPTVDVDDALVSSEPFIDEQSYSEILRGNRYTSRIKGGRVVSGDRPANHRIATKLNARRRSIERAVHDDNEGDEPFELSVGEEDTTILDRYEKIRQTSAEHGAPRDIHPLRGSKKRFPRVAAYSRPDKYTPKPKEIPAENVSILLQEEEDIEDSPFADADDFKPDDDIDLESARDDFDLESDLRGESATQDRPNLRDDLRDTDKDSQSDDRSLRDRVRSRLDDELDLEELDREIDEELDAELDDDEFDDERPNRAPRKTCREFQDELIAGSIRDISLDISPPAASEGAQYGGIARTWTDRRGNILATGALVDLRRGYVILDSGQKLAYARLSEADLAAVSEFWRLPEVCVIGNRGGSPYRSWTPQVVTWKASNLCHKPLYFENTQLERYGHSRGPVAQPIHSTLHFFTRLVALPYMTGICPPNECEYALGYYRPGNCAPWLKEPVPISLQGIRREAMFVTGAAFIP